MTDDMNDPELLQMYEDYKNKLEGKINAIVQLWEKIKKQVNPEDITQFHMMVHKLHGSADMFGYPELGKTTKRLEDLASDIDKQPTQFKENIQPIDDLIRLIKHQYETIPQVIPSDEVAKPVQMEKAAEPEKQKSKEPSMTIFLLDDQSSEDNLITQMTKFGYKVNKFTNVADFIENFKKDTDGVMVINIGMVNEVLKNILFDNVNKPDESKIPIIFISNSGEFKLRLQAVRMGSQGFFVRPFQIEDLINQIDHALKSATFTYHVLIVDDEMDIAKYNAAILEQAKIKTFIIIKSSEIDRALHEFKPDLILIDINMPDCNGLELAAIIRQQSIFQSTPIIYLSSEVDEQKKLNAMKLGADDFISKGTSKSVLVTTVKNRIERYKKLTSLLVRDNLTGLYNQSFIRKQLEIEVKESMILHNPLSIALIDLDKLKNINETYGHQAGDHVLKSLGIMLRKRLRPNDIIGRYGTEKFLVILPNTTLEAATAMIDELRKNFLTFNYSWNNQMFNASFSAGTASFPEFHTVDELIDAVDETVAKSKKTGLNRVEATTPLTST